jgi:hypothetical protein
MIATMFGEFIELDIKERKKSHIYGNRVSNLCLSLSEAPVGDIDGVSREGC